MPSRGGQPYRTTDKAGEQIFQFTTSRGGRRNHSKGERGYWSAFNSRPLGEVDPLFRTLTLRIYLSIHDLSGRSTQYERSERTHETLSIHDLSGRSTWIRCRLLRRERSFNSRPLGEVDTLSTTDSSARIPFNSRPLGEVDFPGGSDTNQARSPFNSRPLGEVDSFTVHRFQCQSIFQFTTSRGGRQEGK